MKFEWDEAKRRENIRKHRIDFEDVPPVFNGPIFFQLDRRKNYGEDRWIGIGDLGNAVIVVVFIEFDGDTIRLISARKAEKHERDYFKEKIRKIGN